MHVILVWVLNFVSGLLAGIALVASLFSLVFVLLANGYLDWSAHRVEEPPFQLHERRTPPTSYVPVMREHVETCLWLNMILEMVVFNTAESRLAQLVQELLVTRLEDRLVDFLTESRKLINDAALKNVRLGRRAPHIKDARVNCDATLDISFDVEFEGDLSFLLEICAGMGIGRLATKLKVRRFSGRVLFKLTTLPSPRVLVMFSELPLFNFAVEYGEKALGRISNVLVLILGSLLGSRAVFPNYQPILLRPDADLMRNVAVVPLWRTSRRFVKIRIDCVGLGVLTNGAVSCLLSVGSARIRTEEYPPAKIMPLGFVHQFSLDEYEQFPEINVSVVQRRNKYSKKTVLFEAHLPLSVVPENVIYPLGLRSGDSGFFVNLDVYYCTDPLAVNPENPWPLAADLKMNTANQYLDGVNWSNFKLAWSNFRKSTDLDEHEAAYIKILTGDVPSKDLLPSPSLSADAISDFKKSTNQSLNSLSELASPSAPPSVLAFDDSDGGDDASFELIPAFVDVEEIGELNISHSGWYLCMDSQRFSCEYSPGSSSKPPNDIKYSGYWGIDGPDCCSLSMNDKDFLSIYKYPFRPLFIADMKHLESASAIINDQVMIILSLNTGTHAEMRLSEVDGAALMVLLCSHQKVIKTAHTFTLESCHDAHLVNIGKWIFLALAYKVVDDGLVQFVVPLPQEFEPQAEMICRRLCRRAAMLTGSGHGGICLRMDPAPLILDPHADIKTAFGVLLHESDVQVSLQCYMKRSLPVPGRLYFTNVGVLFRGKLEKRVFVPIRQLDSIGLVNRWHARGVCVCAAGEAFEFMQLTEMESLSISRWCEKYDIPWQ